MPDRHLVRTLLIACAVAAAALLSVSPAHAAKSCGAVSQEPSGSGGAVVYIARRIRTTGGTTCLTARTVVRSFLKRGISPNDPVTVRGYICEVQETTTNDERIVTSGCQSVASARRRITFSFDLVGGN